MGLLDIIFNRSKASENSDPLSRAEQAISEKNRDELAKVLSDLHDNHRKKPLRHYWAEPLILIGDIFIADPKYYIPNAISAYRLALYVAFKEGDVQQRAVERILKYVDGVDNISYRIYSRAHAACSVRAGSSMEMSAVTALIEDIEKIPEASKRGDYYRSIYPDARAGSLLKQELAKKREETGRALSEETPEHAAVRRFVQKHGGKNFG
jgi:hypothetical protein